MRRIYLDYAASTPVDRRVLRVMEPYFAEQFGNPGSLHRFGQDAIAAVDEARETIARAIGADFREVLFTGSATEANNLALRGVMRRASGIKKPRIIISAVEHESVLETARDLEKEGAEIVVIPVDEGGTIDMRKLLRALDERTVLVSVMYAQNEVGTVQPITDISAMIRHFRERTRENIYPLVHTDAVQALQFLSCRPDELGVDLMTLSAHKIYGPKGIGALYVKNMEYGIRNVGMKRRNTENQYSTFNILHSQTTGGGQEFGLRSGTENVPAIVGFAEAVRLADVYRQKETERLRALMQDAWSGIRRTIRGATVNGASVADPNERLPNVLNIYVPRMGAEELLTRLDLAGIAASSGSACSARSTKPSHVLRAMGRSAAHASRSIRLSFGRGTTRRDVRDLCVAFWRIFKKHSR